MKLFIPIILVGLVGCAKNELYVGYSFPENYQEHLKIGRTTMDDALQLLGTPTTQSSYGDPTYYYISQQQISTSFMLPKVEKQDILALTFNKKGTLIKAQHYDIHDYKKITQEDATRTALKGNEMGVMEQMMHNVGRFGGKTKPPVG